jgi:hypothetical protein
MIVDSGVYGTIHRFFHPIGKAENVIRLFSGVCGADDYSTNHDDNSGESYPKSGFFKL